MTLRSLDWVSVVVPSIKTIIEFRDRGWCNKEGCVEGKVLSLVQIEVEVPAKYPVRHKNVKLVGISIEVIRVDDQTMRVWMNSTNESMLRGHFKKQVKEEEPL